MRLSLNFALLMGLLLTISCTEEKKEEKPIPPTNVIYVPTNMVQSPDGKLRSKNNYLYEKSDKDIDVVVTGSKIDTLQK